jgi:hypothetical protein
VEREFVRVRCPKCGVTSNADPRPSSWQCTSCQKDFFLRRCSSCFRVCFVDAKHEYKREWPCNWCGEPNTGLAAASVAQLAEETARLESLTGETEREPVPGILLASATLGPASHRRPRRRWVLPAAALTAALAVCAAAVVLLLPAKGGSSALPATSPTAASNASTGSAGSSVPGDTDTGTPLTSPSAGASKSAAPTGTATSGGMSGLVNMAEVVVPVNVTASGISTVDYQGAPGRLTIVSTASGQVALTGQVTGTGTPTVKSTNEANGTLAITVTCAAGGTCNGVLQLAVPHQTALTVQQPGGNVTATGLGGPLSFSGSNVDITATGLTSASLTATVTSGQLDATFTVPPSQVSVTLTSATAMLALPTSVPYRVVNPGSPTSVNSTVPESATAANTVTVNINSGELQLQPS